MVEQLHDEVAVVTGGGQGIGEKTCLLLAEEGADVVIIDVDQEAAQKAADRIESSTGSDALPLQANVGSDHEIRKAAEKVEKEVGSIDHIVNNAAIRVEPGPVTEAGTEAINNIIDVNLKGAIFCSKYFIPLVDSGGSIVHVSSVGAETPREGWSLYDSTKGALQSLAKDMACDHANEDIRVNAISPGWAITEYHLGDRSASERKEFLHEKTQPHEDGPGILQRAATPREIAQGILFLVSEQSSYVTGRNLDVDGGGL